jgi:hypothetical protein
MENIAYHEAGHAVMYALCDLPFDSMEETLTAFHEAGHAVLYALWDLPFDSVEVFTDKHPAPPELKGDYAGLVRSDLMRDCPNFAMPWSPDFRIDRAHQHWERLICVSLAGQLAESRYLGHSAPKFVGRHDQRDIRYICRHLMGCPASILTDFIAGLRLRTVKLLDRMWSAVTAVAVTLLNQASLTRAEVRALVRAPRTPSVRKCAKRRSEITWMKPESTNCVELWTRPGLRKPWPAPC